MTALDSNAPAVSPDEPSIGTPSIDATVVIVGPIERGAVPDVKDRDRFYSITPTSIDARFRRRADGTWAFTSLNLGGPTTWDDGGVPRMTAPRQPGDAPVEMHDRIGYVGPDFIERVDGDLIGWHRRTTDAPSWAVAWAERQRPRTGELLAGEIELLPEGSTGSDYLELIAEAGPCRCGTTADALLCTEQVDADTPPELGCLVCAAIDGEWPCPELDDDGGYPPVPDDATLLAYLRRSLATQAAHEADPKYRSPEYVRGHADGRNAERAGTPRLNGAFENRTPAQDRALEEAAGYPPTHRSDAASFSSGAWDAACPKERCLDHEACAQGAPCELVYETVDADVRVMNS